MKSKIFINSSRISAIFSLFCKIKPGQKVLFYFFVKGPNRTLRIISHVGLILSIRKNQQRKIKIIIKKCIFNYNFRIRLSLSSSAFLRFFFI